MDVSQIVNVSVSATGPAPTQPGFGIPMILGTHTHNTDLIRAYTSTAAMLTDGFLVTDSEYLAAVKMLSSSPSVPQFMVGRRALLPTFKVRITPTAVNSSVYALTVGGSAASYTSDSSATVAEITAGLKTAIDALAVSGVTTTDNTTSLDVTLAAGKWVQIGLVGPVQDSSAMRALLSFKMIHTDPGIATDLAAIAAVNTSWYGLVATFASDAEITAMAAWAETNAKLCLQHCIDTDIVGSGTSDEASTLKTAAYNNTGMMFHPDTASFAGAGYLGATFPFNPGGVDFKFRTMPGVATVNLSQTEINNAAGKNCNTYVLCAGLGVTQEGVAASGQFLDITRDVAWFKSRLQVRFFTLSTSQPKVPYTNKGIAQGENQIRAQMLEGQEAGFIATDRPFTVTAPSAASQSSTDRSNRQYNAYTFTAPEAGAIHKFTLTGVVTP